MNRSMLGIILAASTGILWGFTSLCTKLMGNAGVDVSISVFVRMVMVALCVGGWLWVKDPRQLRIAKADALKLFFFSALGPTGLYLGFMLSIVYLNVSTALVLHYTYPIVITIFSGMVTGEKPRLCHLIGAIVVTVGVGCSVLTPEWTLNTNVSVKGLVLGVIAVMGLASESLLARATVTRGGMTNWAFFCYTHLFGIFWTALYITAVPGWQVFQAVTPYISLLILVPTILGCLIGYGIYYKALEYIPASVGGLMTSLEIFAGVVLTSFATKVWPTAPEMLGCVFIFSAIAYVSFAENSAKK